MVVPLETTRNILVYINRFVCLKIPGLVMVIVQLSVFQAVAFTRCGEYKMHYLHINPGRDIVATFQYENGVYFSRSIIKDPVGFYRHVALFSVYNGSCIFYVPICGDYTGMTKSSYQFEYYSGV